MHSEGKTKTLVQCDFDGTITVGDVSFVLLDTFADEGWRQLLKEYQDGKMSVGRFNASAFAMVKADRKTLLSVARNTLKLRPGFHELVACCREKGFRFVIVSNGLDFYIEEVLKYTGETGIEFFAAKTQFHPEGLKVQYIGPDGNSVDSDFKGAYVNLFLIEGYRVLYVGNGDSDFSPAKRCHYVFATDNLLAHCRQARLDCVPFTDLNEVARVIERL